MDLSAMGFPGALPDWSDLNILPARAHFYTYPNQESALTLNRDQSHFHTSILLGLTDDSLKFLMSGMVIRSDCVRRHDSGEFQKSGTKLLYKSGGSSFGFDLLQGNATWNINGVDIFQRGPELSFHRALTQNDAASSGDGPIWEQEKIPMIYPQVRDVTWRVDDGGTVLHYKVRVSVKTRAWGVEADMIYKIPTSGPQRQLEAQGELVGKNELHVIPRTGLMAVLPKSFDDVSWFGRGPGESYKDSKQSSRIGQYSSTVPDLFTYYDYPQENGNREDLRWLKIGNKDVTLDARRTESEPFSFTARRYMPFDLDDV
ncbi:beta-galactosidase [Fusarium mundagurra]|uniref:beta-galactosidase n=1 Tax=Fusarium mundagurra TaxID=1567541 RepID=A0A8H5YI80_9HYPO|nr:beta-galactosidase [Fusarium mundagurra]